MEAPPRSRAPIVLSSDAARDSGWLLAGAGGIYKNTNPKGRNVHPRTNMGAGIFSVILGRGSRASLTGKISDIYTQNLGNFLIIQSL